MEDLVIFTGRVRPRSRSCDHATANKLWAYTEGTTKHTRVAHLQAQMAQAQVEHLPLTCQSVSLMDTKQKDLSGTMYGGCGEYRSFPSQKNVICVVEFTLTFACGVIVVSNVQRNKILNRVARDEVAVHCSLHGDPKQMRVKIQWKIYGMRLSSFALVDVVQRVPLVPDPVSDTRDKEKMAEANAFIRDSALTLISLPEE